MKTSHLNYAELIAAHGVSRNILNSVLVNNFHIEDTYLPALEFYRVTHMSGNMFRMASKEGTIKYNRVKTNPKPDCVIIYNDCTRAKAIAATEIRISFRAAKEEYNLPAYALVQIVSI